MKLNYDCIRDILMLLEEKTDGVSIVSYDFTKTSTNCPLVGKYTSTEIRYHIQQCEYDGLLINSEWTMDNTFTVLDISPKAHQFLANVRSQTIWEKVKAIAVKIGVVSLQALIQISNTVTAEQIQSSLLQ